MDASSNLHKFFVYVIQSAMMKIGPVARCETKVHPLGGIKHSCQRERYCLSKIKVSCLEIVVSMADQSKRNIKHLGRGI